ncbi:MAG: hypothetical protein DMD45_03360 [Gemmatimonadetes bacterium]|nr:MAG: hypothetical protein DMD45_03360 [Gemmatimonadota bacterium]
MELEMARELKRWLAAALAAWGVIVIGYVPPRGVAPVATARPRPPQPTAARLRAQALAEAWRDADLALRLARYRRQLEPELARRREADQAGPAVVVEAPDSLAAYAGEVVRSALDTVWRELGLGVSKVGVGVVVDLWRTRPAGTGQTPKVVAGSASHLLPDSTDRTTCVALIPAWYRTATLRTSSGPGRRQQVEDWLQAGLGPCAFLAAWGVPGSDVRRWLARRSYDLAAFPSWDRDWSMQSQSQWMSVRFATDAKAAPTWWWPAVYGHPIAAIGCLAGRAASCRTAVLSDSVPRVLPGDRGWWVRNERLVLGNRYLGDVAREVGHDRFLRFWNSPEPVDTALATALKMPVGEWTERWERRFAPRLPLGAAAPVSAAVLGILLAAVAVVLVARGAGRRQVR